LSVRRISRVVVLCIAALIGRRASAQPTTSLQPDARVLPRHAFGARVLTGWTRWDELSGIPSGSSSNNVAWSLNTDSLGTTAVPQFTESQTAIRSLSGLTNFRLTAGNIVAAADSRVVTAPLILEYGITSRVTIGAVVPLVESRSVISAQLNPKLGLANVGPNPGLTNSTARTNAATLVTSFRTAATQLQTKLTQCQATPSGTGCDVILAQQADVTALIQSTGTFTTGVETLYGTDQTQPGQALVPINSSPAQQAIQARIQGMIVQYGKFLPGTPISGSVVGAGGPPAYRDLQALLVSAGYDTLGTVDRASIGDVSLGLTAQFINTLTDTGATHGYRVSFSGSFRFPTGQPGSRNRLFDVPTGYGQPGIQVGGAADAIFNKRYSGTAVASFTQQIGSVDVARIPNAANAVFPLSDPTKGTFSAGDVLWLWLAPRIRITGYLTANAQYMLTHIGADSYSPSSNGNGVAGAGSATTQAIGFGFAYSAVANGGPMGRALPVELTFSHLETVMASGGPVAKAWREQIGVRIFLAR
jgi:hypothetical protein